jgi:hypothetical protein
MQSISGIDRKTPACLSGVMMIGRKGGVDRTRLVCGISLSLSDT